MSIDPERQSTQESVQAFGVDENDREILLAKAQAERMELAKESTLHKNRTFLVVILISLSSSLLLFAALIVGSIGRLPTPTLVALAITSVVALCTIVHNAAVLYAIFNANNPTARRILLRLLFNRQARNRNSFLLFMWLVTLVLNSSTSSVEGSITDHPGWEIICAAVLSGVEFVLCTTWLALSTKEATRIGLNTVPPKDVVH